MASETATSAGVSTGERFGNWKAGMVGGLIGAAVFGAMMSAMTPAVLEVAIPSLYGLAPPANGLAGWLLHMSHGAVLGVVFAGAVGAAGLGGRSARTVAGVGVGYGLLVWVLLAVVVMPLWLGAVGSPANPPFPNVGVESFLGHAVYGAVLGVSYYALEGL